MTGIKAEIIKTWSATPARDSEGREWVWRHYKVAEQFENALRGYIESGKYEFQLRAKKERESMTERVSNLFGGRKAV